MSARSGIAKSMSAKMIADINGTGIYVNNLYSNVSSKVIHFDDITDYPYVSVSPGPETREDMPSNFTMARLNLYIRVFVDNEEDAQGQLESIISDIETFVDNNLRLSYNITTINGLEARQTVTNTIISISTDEGLLDPKAIGEVVLEVLYEKLRY